MAVMIDRLAESPESAVRSMFAGLNLLLILLVLAIMMLMYVQRHGPPL